MKSENIKPAGKTGGFARPAVLCLLLVAVTLAIYWPVTRCGFVNYDDPDYFTSNTRVLAGLTRGNIAWAFSTMQTANWHPLTWLSLMLDADLFGKDPMGPHATNLFFHLANTVLIFLLFRRWTAATWRSAFVAALFALHPLHVESVAWISERKDVLSTFFGLLSLVAWGEYVEKAEGQRLKAKVFYWLALVFFVLGLMSKPMLVTLPFVMLLLDYWPLERFKVQGSKFKIQSLVWEKAPFFVLSAISCAVTFIAQQKGGAVVALVRISMAGRLENTFVAYARYLGKTIWPVNLAVLYPHPGHWAAGLVIFSLALVAGLSVAAVWLGRRFPFVPVGWFWFIGTLVPVIGLVQVGGQSMADRYTYLPLVGLFVILAWGGRELWLRWNWLKPFIVLAAGLLLAAGAWQTRIQARCWQNTEMLFQHALAVTQNNIVACNKLASFYSRQGRMTEAMDYYARALRINPDDADVLYDLGNAFAQQGDWDNAIGSYRHALQVTPNQADILNNLGFALAAKKQIADAIACFEAALKLNPDSASTHNNLAAVLSGEHRLEEAVQHYREALRVTPDDPRICVNLGDTLIRLGKPAEAIPCYQAALRLKPDDSKIKARLQALGAPVSN